MSSEKPIQSRPDASNEAWETTAQRAKLEASTLELSDEVEKNARREAEVAKHAAQAAPVRRLGLSPSAIPSLQILTCFFLGPEFLPWCHRQDLPDIPSVRSARTRPEFEDSASR